MVEQNNIQGRRTTDQHVTLTAFCGPITGSNIKLTLKPGAAEELESIEQYRRVGTMELITQAKLRCQPLRGSINSRYMAIAVLRGAL